MQVEFEAREGGQRVWQLLKKFAENHEGLMADVADNDVSAPSDTALDFGRYLSAEAAELLRLAVENSSYWREIFTR